MSRSDENGQTSRITVSDEVVVELGQGQEITVVRDRISGSEFRREKKGTVALDRALLVTSRRTTG
jgi:hypothetical protein